MVIQQNLRLKRMMDISMMALSSRFWAAKREV
jgi:hypothetical protein